MKKGGILLLILVIGLALAGCQATRAGYEAAPYKVVRSDGKFELRDYPELTVVETRMAGGGNPSDGSFNRLFRFITGGNDAKQKIAMTTPVLMSGEDTNATMAFVMPAKIKKGEVPKPLDGNLTVRDLAAPNEAAISRLLAEGVEQREPVGNGGARCSRPPSTVRYKRGFSSPKSEPRPNSDFLDF